MFYNLNNVYAAPNLDTIIIQKKKIIIIVIYLFIYNKKTKNINML